MKRMIVASTVAMLAMPACRAAGDDLYVAMGSSYAAGPGVGEPDPASGACNRSLSNFARLVARRRRLTLRDISCSGATTANILEHGQYGFPAQIEAVTPETRFVSVLIGGNDVNYVGNLLGLSCRATSGAGCDLVSPDEVDRRFAALPGRLAAVVAAIRHRAPHARIVLIDYLPAIPAAGAKGCAALPLTAEDAARTRAVAARLAEAIGGAAAAAGVPVVRASRIGIEHDACSAAPWVTGFHPPRNPGWSAPVPYHLNQDGMDGVADEVEALLLRGDQR